MIVLSTYGSFSLSFAPLKSHLDLRRITPTTDLPINPLLPKNPST